MTDRVPVTFVRKVPGMTLFVMVAATRIGAPPKRKKKDNKIIMEIPVADGLITLLEGAIKPPPPLIRAPLSLGVAATPPRRRRKKEAVSVKAKIK
mgnify:CR=1 FL=1